MLSRAWVSRNGSSYAVRGGTLALVMVTLLTAGCHHRRATMRPVIVGPPPVVAPAVVVPEDSGVVVPEGATVVTPPAGAVPAPGALPGQGFEDSNVPGSLSPVAPPAERAPTAEPGPSDEPPLRPSPPASIQPKAEGAPPLQRPSASWNTQMKRNTPRVALRERVQPFVNDPSDLFAPPRADRPWKYIVLHHSASATGSYAQIDREHRQVQGWNGCGYHFVIGNGSESPDGQIEVAQRWSDQKGGAHCRNGKTPEVNDYGIGICLVGNFDDAPPTPKQVEAARALVAYLRDRYQIAPDHIGTHGYLASGPTACPGKNFPAASIVGTRGVAMH